MNIHAVLDDALLIFEKMSAIFGHSEINLEFWVVLNLSLQTQNS